MDRHEKTVKVDSAQKRSSSKFFDMVCSNRSGKKIIVDKSIHEESKTSVIKQLQFDSEDKSLGRLMDTK